MKNNPIVIRVLKVLLILAGVVILVAIFIFAPLEREHYQGKEYYQKTKSELGKNIPQTATGGSLKAGWAKVSIVPIVPVSIASYGLRDNFEGVHDTIWCRTFVFDNGHNKSALVTLDLLIFPPVVVRKLKEELPKIGFTLDNTFLSASHTHNGAGGWAEGIGGRFLAGKYSEEYVDQLTKAVIASIKEASSSMESASIGFGMYEAKKYVFNRFTDKEDALDHWLRVIKIQKKSGENAAIVTYAAHPNVLSSKIDQISGDYAGALVDSLEKKQEINFAAFCAGTVGGHRCKMDDTKNYEFIGKISGDLADKIGDNFSSIELKDSIKIKTIFTPLYFRDPQLKIAKDIKVRPWFFNCLFNEQELFLSAMMLGDIVLVGTPCDFSGELIKEFSLDTSDKKIHLVVTSFNGGYIGYIIPDKYYDLPRREAREMNWYGPYSGSYFVEIIKTLLQKI